jgi:multisubunit Na+/H+ antiporter MnhG subunit
MEVSSLGKVLVVVGLVVVALGALLVLGGALGLGRLPGDFAWRRGNVRVYVPLATCLLLSLLVTLVLTLLSRR